MIHYSQSAQISQKQDERNKYLIIKTMCPPDYHHNGFVETHVDFSTLVRLHIPANNEPKNA